MQTLTIGRTKYKLSPSRNVGELQAKVSKITGKTKKTAIAKERRSYPVFYAGQSTDEYVKSFYMLNFRDTIGSFFEPLNCEPCTLYSGEDLHETLTDDDCAQESADTVRDVSEEMTGEEFDAIGEAFSALTPSARARTTWDTVKNEVLSRLRGPMPAPAPRPRVIYSEFIRSAGKREAPMMA